MSEKEHALEMQEEKTRQSRRLLLLSLLVAALLLILVVVLARNAIQRKKQNETLTRLNNTKDQLLTVVSHDIKTPLLSHEKILDILCKHINDMPLDDLEDYLISLKSSTQELRVKTVNVIGWVKSMIGDNESQAEPFNLCELAETVMHSQAFAIEQKQLKVINAIPTDWMGNDDLTIIEMVLQNILSNAVKYSFANGEIRLEAEDGGERYLVKVIDHGKGIENPDQLLKMTTASTEGTFGESGTGIGLFVSQQMMERNGGTIAIESAEGKGTTVVFSIKK